MSLFEDIAKKLNLKKGEPASKTEAIQEDRNNIKLNLAVKLYQKGCTDEEVEEVLAVIETAETDIQTIKNSLNGTNINPEGDPMKALQEGIEKMAPTIGTVGKELAKGIKEGKE